MIKFFEIISCKNVNDVFIYLSHQIIFIFNFLFSVIKRSLEHFEQQLI